ncbi:hypothetical protein EYF80_023882 [Liparis tanakae]|uniref:Uncharacterized protein n=1 Tax=Liparis tanakae TaxID=230148 RepID=A0A4Z2HM67_9TELE|nr:hypothetical protein EYF80_023882 [Liparis tanakae]
MQQHCDSEARQIDIAIDDKALFYSYSQMSALCLVTFSGKNEELVALKCSSPPTCWALPSGADDPPVSETPVTSRQACRETLDFL